MRFARQRGTIGETLEDQPPEEIKGPPKPPTDCGVRTHLLSRRTVRIVLGLFWLLDGALQLEPAKFASDYPLGNLAQSVMGAPEWVNRSIFAGIDPFVSHWALWNLGAGLIEVAIGLCLVSGKLTRVALGTSFAWALVIWWLGEGFGMLPSGFATVEAGAPGSALLYLAIGTLTWPSSERTDVNQRGWAALWSVLWIGAGVLHLPFVYSGGQVFQATLAENSSGEPGPLASARNWFGGIVTHHAGALIMVLALLEVAVGVSWLVDRRQLKIWLVLGIGLSLFFWVVVQQLGAVLTSGGTDPGSGPLMVLLALCAWPTRPSARAATSPAIDGRPVKVVSELRRATVSTSM